MVRLINLFLALFWLLFGVAIFVYQWRTGLDHLPIDALGNRSILLVMPNLGGLSLGWLMLLLCLFNLARWGLLVAGQRKRD